MKHCILPLFFLLLVAACQNKPQNKVFTPGAGDSDTTMVIDSKAAVVDSSVYGRAGECGMSTFCLISDKGDTIFVVRSSDDGYEGRIYGDLNMDDRFCLLTREKGQALLSAINLTQLDKFIKGRYKILNNHVILRGKETEKADTLDVEELSLEDNLLRLKGPQGVLRFRPAEK